MIAADEALTVGAGHVAMRVHAEHSRQIPGGGRVDGADLRVGELGPYDAGEEVGLVRHQVRAVEGGAENLLRPVDPFAWAAERAVQRLFVGRRARGNLQRLHRRRDHGRGCLAHGNTP